MALDLGTLQLQISANTGDAINRLDTVKGSAEDLEKHQNITLNVNANTENATQQISDLQENLSNIGSGSGTVSVDTSSASQSLSDLASKVSTLFSEGGTDSLNIPGLLSKLGSFCSGSLSSTFSTIGSSLLSVLGPAGTVIAALSIAYNTASKWVENIEAKAQEYRETAVSVSITADDIITEATVTGLTTRTTQIISALEGINDVSLSDVEGAIKQLGNTKIKEAIADPTSEAASAFKELGVSLTNADGSNKTAAEVFTETVTAFQKFDGTQAEKDALGYEIFGEKYSTLKPILEQTEGTLENNAKYLYELGAVLSDEELDVLGRLNDLTEWEKLSATGLQNAEALLMADDTGKVTQANTLKNKFKTQALNDEAISMKEWAEAIGLYVEGMVGSATTAQEISNKEEYIDALWDSQTKGLMSDAYFERFESGEGTFYDLIAGAVYWIQDWGADIELMFFDLLNWLGLKDYSIEWTDATPEEEHEDEATEGGQGQNLGDTELSNGETLSEALSDGTIDSYEATDAKFSAVAEAALAMFGLDSSMLSDSQRTQIEGAQRTYDEDLADGEDTVAAFDTLLKSLYDIITGKKGNGVDWANLDQTGNEDVMHYDESTYEDFETGMKSGNWESAYIDNLNTIIEQQATNTETEAEAADTQADAGDKQGDAAGDNAASVKKFSEKIDDFGDSVDKLVQYTDDGGNTGSGSQY